MSKSSRKSIRVVRDKKYIKRLVVIVDCLKIYLQKTFVVIPAEKRRLDTGIRMHLPENIVEALTTIPSKNKARHCQKILKEQNMILKIFNTSFTKTYCVKKNEPVRLLVIIN